MAICKMQVAFAISDVCDIFDACDTSDDFDIADVCDTSFASEISLKQQSQSKNMNASMRRIIASKTQSMNEWFTDHTFSLDNIEGFRSEP